MREGKDTENTTLATTYHDQAQEIKRESISLYSKQKKVGKSTEKAGEVK